MLHVSALFGAIIRHKLQELLFSSFVFSLIDLIDHRSWGRPSAGIQRSGVCTEINRVWSASTSFWQWTAQVVVCLLPLNDVHALQTHWNEMQLCLLGGSEFYFFLFCSAWPVHRVKIKLTINSTPPPPKWALFANWRMLPQTYSLKNLNLRNVDPDIARQTGTVKVQIC